MKPLVRHVGKAAPLRKSNVDTDQIMPARFGAGRVSKAGLAHAMMHDWRRDPEFVLNKPEHDGASILIAGPDFGTGSSREWAVWALMDYGIRVILSPRFGDIFRGNAAANGLVAATLPNPAIARLWEQVEARPHAPLTIDLEERMVSVQDIRYRFEYPEDFRRRIMHGLDDIQLTLQHAVDIAAFEARRRHSKPKIRRRRSLS